ncbi:MAG: RNA polymerase factor sigma-54 [Ktedonobacterales bacterium]|nr:RNA polymerase factor sigma-54 [Ktedonobacterales bacterium]
MILDQIQIPSSTQGINISAKLIASIKVLQYSAEELEQAVAREMGDNPALELEEIVQCVRCGTPLRAGVCPTCERTGESALDGRLDLATWDDFSELRGLASATTDDDAYNPLDFVRSGGTLNEYLTRQLGATLSDRDMFIAEYLIGSLDSHGYITVTLPEAAEVLRVPEPRVLHVLTALQSLDPAGIGARDLRECLLIQIGVFEERGEAPPLVRGLVEHHLRELGEHRFADIAREMGAASTEVKRAWHFIRSNLNPFPAHAFGAGDVPGIGLSNGSERSVIIRPDVVIRRTEHGFEAEVIERRRFRFGVNSMYRDLYHQAKAHKAAQDNLGEAGRQHIRLYVTRARFFMACMRQRWETLSTIANALIEFQYEFLDKGVRYLHPLTRGELATHVGLHESTVSRATANKYVLLPEGRTIPFDEFFDGSLAAKDVLRELIAAENPAHPLSDEDLAALLNQRGLPLARRTVAKYREALGILPSRLRI